ncbi:carbon-nitrogen hydrolase family protein [Paenibacillus silvisoli]|uniref:carbon-nitrogen hydrolase family protein n=1 Tax=Paenibacillus silvisoli TaxID=3110539 RepID=UPI002804244E|nr:carbon-nitrogen hydrolase family protein [Paenibacillus silvisoli]
MNKTIRAAIGSTCSKPGFLDGNLAQIAEMAKRAEWNGCHLLVTPEMSATGYGGYPEALSLAEAPGEGQIYESLARMASATGVVVTAGYVENNGGRLHIAHYAVYPDGRFVSQRKHRVTPAEVPLEPGVTLFYDDTEEIGHVPPGQERFLTFTIHDVQCAIVICADLGIRDLNAILRRSGVELVMLPVGAGGERSQRLSAAELETDEGIRNYKEMLQRNSFPHNGAIECLRNKRAMLAVNMGGFDGRSRYHGGSGSIVSARGEVLAYLPDQPIIDYQQPSFACAELHF